jgi:hypothetical protein
MRNINTQVSQSEKNILADILGELEVDRVNRGGRPPVENKKTTMSFRVTPQVKEWLNSQEESAGLYIEFLILKDMKRKGVKAC